MLLAVSVVFGLLHASQSLAQSQVEDTAIKLPAFEVVSIRADDPHVRPTFSRLQFTPDGFIARNTFMQEVLVLAYGLRDPSLSVRARLIPGAPKWMLSDRYDIQAKMSESAIAELGKLSDKQQDAMKRQMLQSMLADRFKLKLHRETKEAPAYMLVLAKNGPKNMKMEPDNATLSTNWSNPGHGEYHAAPISLLVLLLESLDRIPVLDKTGLPGKYDFTLYWARDPATMLPPGENTSPPPDASGPSIFTALQEQLGLKLVPTKAPLESIVIDHIERPSEN